MRLGSDTARLDDGVRTLTVWQRRLAPYWLAGLPLTIALVAAYERLGAIGALLFSIPPASIVLSVRHHLVRTRTRAERLRVQVAQLEESAERAQRTGRDTIAALTRAMESRDCYGGDHADRVAEIAVALARRLGYHGDELAAIELGALLHDVGKLTVPERILQKTGSLDANEWATVRRQLASGGSTVAGLHPFVSQIARSVHERVDGAGYPDGLAGDEIPLPARIVLVADAFEALTSDRPYRARRPEHQALAEIRAHAGTQFCPLVVRELDRLAREQPHVLGTIPVWAVNVA